VRDNITLAERRTRGLRGQYNREESRILLPRVAIRCAGRGGSELGMVAGTEASSERIRG
jgi:hypothetical protein